MMNIRDAVLATLAFNDALGLPLTPFQTWQYLVNPARLAPEQPVSAISFSDVVQELVSIVHARQAVEYVGCYALSPNLSQSCELQREREKVVAQKFRQLLNAAFWLQAVPYVRALAVSGSLALGVTDENGDFDLFVVSKACRLYTCRFFLLVMATLMGRRRKPQDLHAPNKFCFNHYVTDAGLCIQYESIFTAQVFARLIPVWDPDAIFPAFWKANVWINRFLYNFRPDQQYAGRNIGSNWLLRAMAKVAEIILNSKPGDWLENFMRWFQQRRIAHNPLTHEPGGRVVYTDAQLEFHPNSIEKAVLSRYHEWLTKLNITAPAEPNSGLLQ